MLRLPEGCYAMSLFAVKLPQIRNIFEAASPAEFCRQMGLVAQATVAALAHEKCFMGYAGEGIIVGTVMGRHRIKPEEIQKDIEDILSHDGTAARIGGDFSADVTVKLVSNQRLWSGLSACNTLRDFLGRETVPDSTSTDREAVIDAFAPISQEDHPAYNARVARVLDLAGMSADSDRAIVFKTNTPNAAFPWSLSDPALAVLGTTSEAFPINATGPYIFREAIVDQFYRVEAVSYTHLTLPTIYSV